MSLGQQNEERPSWVRFEVIAKEDKAASQAAGHYVARDIELALITPPGTKDVFKQEIPSWFDQLERDASAGRIPTKWVDDYKEAYRRWKNGQDIPLNGTPLKGWLRISPAQQKTLIEMGVRTIEDLASLNDEGLRRIGMGAVQLKQVAQAELQAAKDIGPVVKENAALKQEVALLKGSVETLTGQVEALMQMVKAEGAAPTMKETLEITAADIIPDDDIVAQYTQKFGQPPHHRMKPETIAAKLKE